MLATLPPLAATQLRFALALVLLEHKPASLIVSEWLAQLRDKLLGVQKRTAEPHELHGRDPDDERVRHQPTQKVAAQDFWAFDDDDEQQVLAAASTLSPDLASALAPLLSPLFRAPTQAHLGHSSSHVSAPAPAALLRQAVEHLDRAATEQLAVGPCTAAGETLLAVERMLSWLVERVEELPSANRAQEALLGAWVGAEAAGRAMEQVELALVQLAEDLVTAPVVDNPVATACLAAIFIRISSLPSAAPLDTILPALVEALCVTLEEILAGADSPSLASEQSTRLSRRLYALLSLSHLVLSYSRTALPPLQGQSLTSNPLATGPHSLLATVHARLTRLIGSYGVDTHLATLALSAPQLSSTGGAESGLGSEMGARTVEEGVLGLWERVGALLDAAR